jgi:5'-3' exonuclease
MIVHLIDGTYELFRHFYGLRRFHKTDPPFGAVSGVLHMTAKMIEDGATHIGVATDHIIESFRNELWPGYKTGAGIERALLAQFHPLEEALTAMGVVVWPMIEFEADDALAAAAHLAAKNKKVEKVCIWTPDKISRSAWSEIESFRQTGKNGSATRPVCAEIWRPTAPFRTISRWLAACGPGIKGLGAKTAASLINRFGPIEEFPAEVLNEGNRELAMLFKTLATLRTDATLVSPTVGRQTRISDLEWKGPTSLFEELTKKLGEQRLAARVGKLVARD